MAYDSVIIGAGMSGLAAGIRQAMYGKKVLICEHHTIGGGLNSYYQRRIREYKENIQFDVGLHALTNFAIKGDKKKPLNKLLRQLRIPYDALSLQEQTFSQIQFKSAALNFSNDFELLRSEVEKVFPSEIDNFNRLTNHIIEFNEVDLNAVYTSAKEVIASYIKTPLLQEMVIAPLLIYGSAWEDDMDFSQFAIMFKSIYLEGFSRPTGGVRSIIKLLEDKFKEVGGELWYRADIEKIEKTDIGFKLYLNKDREIECKKVFSSAGFPETMKLFEKDAEDTIGKMSFTETILVTENKINQSPSDPTIIFYNETDEYKYRNPNALYDASSAVICLPDNYETKNNEGRGVIRTTFMATYNKWFELERDEYLKQKANVLL